jgi:hypothetical protein
VRLAAAALVLFVAPLAFADGPQVEVMADVILASNKDSTIDPPELAKMKDEFAAAGISFTSYRRLSSQKLKIVKEPPTQLALPNQRAVSLRLLELKDGAATVKLEIPKAIQTTVALGKKGSVFQHAGPHEGGQLVLVLSSPR